MGEKMNPLNSSFLFRTGALYIRVSTDKQEELSPDAQKRLLLEYARKNKILIKPEYIFIENGISGRAADKRPEFQRMISLAKESPSPFNTILLWKYSRFARNQEESIVYKSLLRRQCNVEVISITEPLIEGPFGSLIERIIEWMDEYYSINLSGETIRGMSEKAIRGGYQSTPPLGYKAIGQGQPFIVDESESKIVSYIFDQYCLHHKSPTTIARQLNDLGMRTKRNGSFEKRNVTYILRNPFYIGTLHWNGITAAGRHKTFISEDLFQKAQKLLDSSYSPVNRHTISTCKHWLSGLVKCSVCGASLSYNACRYPFFNCWKYAKGYHKKTTSISEKNLTKGVLEYFEYLFQGLHVHLHVSFPSNHSALETSFDLVLMELKTLSLREQRIQYAYETGIDSSKEYKEKKNKIAAERSRLEELQKEMKKTVSASKQEETFNKIRTVSDMLKSPDVSQETKGAFIRSVIEEIIYDKESDTLTFYLYSK